MNGENYSLAWNGSDFAYEFYSEGPRGKIKKQVKFQPLQQLGEHVLNVALGDKDENTGHFDNFTISNNNDRVKVLSTVAKAIFEFIDLRPACILLIEGNTMSRTRLYQMAISSFWLNIELRLEVLGQLGNDWVPFQKGVNYERFLIFKKIK
jgi:hypothetical protein